MARLKEKYRGEIAPALAKEFDIKNPMAIPKIGVPSSSIHALPAKT